VRFDESTALPAPVVRQQVTRTARMSVSVATKRPDHNAPGKHLEYSKQNFINAYDNFSVFRM
jgi:hypothetical protein